MRRSLFISLFLTLFSFLPCASWSHENSKNLSASKSELLHLSHEEEPPAEPETPGSLGTEIY